MFNGRRLKELRLNRGLTQKDLGKVINVTKASICCYEKETRTPTVENLLDMVNFFGVTSDYLLGNDSIINVKKEPNKKIYMTEEEIKFIKELRNNKFLAEILLEDPVRSLELLEKKIG